METNRRVSERHLTLGLMSNIFDGRSAVLGVVEDISHAGIRISNIPASFEDNVLTCYTVVNGPRRDFHLALQPRWVQFTNRGMYKMIGFQIQEPPPSWTGFIDSIESNSCAEDPFCALVAGSTAET